MEGRTKKLEEVARWWAAQVTRKRATNEGEVDFSHYPPEIAEKMRRRVAGKITPDECGVWSENAEAVGLFLDCETQWRISMSGITGLDYTAVATVMDLRGIADRQDCFQRLQVLEGTALAAIAKAEN